MSKHTEGPWHVGGKANHPIVFDANGNAICDCTVFHGKHQGGQSEANAKLIAAAPELLEVCEWAISHIDRRKVQLLNALRAAIEKASAK